MKQPLRNWAEKKGTDGIEEYWVNRNRVSIDGRTTGIINKVVAGITCPNPRSG